MPDNPPNPRERLPSNAIVPTQEEDVPAVTVVQPAPPAPPPAPEPPRRPSVQGSQFGPPVDNVHQTPFGVVTVSRSWSVSINGEVIGDIEVTVKAGEGEAAVLTVTSNLR